APRDYATTSCGVLSAEGGPDHGVECAQHRREATERLAQELGRTRRERRERRREQAGLESSGDRVRPRDVKGEHVRLAANRARGGQSGPRGGGEGAPPSREEIGAGFFAVALEHLLNERVGLPNGQAATHEDGARGDMVAPWQPTDGDGRARGSKTQPDAELYPRLA